MASQAVLALLYVAGGYYKTSQVEVLASQFDIPARAWRAVGIFEVCGGLLLIVPAATKWVPIATPVAAAILTLETLALCWVYGQRSLKPTAENPLVWAIVMALLVAFVAYGRIALEPLT